MQENVVKFNNMREIRCGIDQLQWCLIEHNHEGDIEASNNRLSVYALIREASEDGQQHPLRNLSDGLDKAMTAEAQDYDQSIKFAMDWCSFLPVSQNDELQSIRWLGWQLYNHSHSFHLLDSFVKNEPTVDNLTLVQQLFLHSVQTNNLEHFIQQQLQKPWVHKSRQKNPDSLFVGHVFAKA